MAGSEEQGATGRRFVVSIALVALGIGIVIYGLIEQQWWAFAGGIVMILIFGLTAAGMERGEASAGPLKVKTDFNAPPLPPALPPPASSEAGDEPKQAP